MWCVHKRTVEPTRLVEARREVARVEAEAGSLCEDRWGYADPKHEIQRALLEDQHHLCAYCGHEYGAMRLTRDHVVPLSQGGRDTWMNLVTACRGCNQRKGGRTPERAGMQLLYAPYVPNRAEYLILSNRHILADQMDFLARHLPTQSRVLPG